MDFGKKAEVNRVFLDLASVKSTKLRYFGHVMQKNKSGEKHHPMYVVRRKEKSGRKTPWTDNVTSWPTGLLHFCRSSFRRCATEHCRQK